MAAPPIVRTQMIGIWKMTNRHFQRQVLSVSTATRHITNCSNNGEKWDVFASVCLERKPQISKPMTRLEKKYIAFLNEFELESSYKSDHEIRHMNDERLAEKIKTGEVDSGTIQTAQDFEDKSNAELHTFIPMSRRTEADEQSDMKSLNRALDSHLVLVVEQKLGSGYRWSCPQLKVEPNQTLRQAAERILQELCPSINAKVMGNAPFGFYHYKYPAGVKNEAGDEVRGAKVFFYKANYVNGKMETPASETIQVKDFLWLKREELESKLQEQYHKKIKSFLVSEGDEYVNDNSLSPITP